MDYQIEITVDTNDGDYDTACNKISLADLDKIMPLINQIKAFKSYSRGGYTHYHNYPTRDCLRDDMGELPPGELYDVSEEIQQMFEDFLPWNEYGFHTIEFIQVSPWENKVDLLDVNQGLWPKFMEGLKKRIMPEYPNNKSQNCFGQLWTPLSEADCAECDVNLGCKLQFRQNQKNA